MCMTKQLQKDEWVSSDERRKLMALADKAGKIFERGVKEEEEYELRATARKILTS